MGGHTAAYEMEPRGEYVFGVIGERPMCLRRGGQRRLIVPGQLLALDPSHRHAGAAVDSRPWLARLMVVEVADLAAVARDEELPLPADVAFPDPVLPGPDLATAFLRLYASLLRPSATRLERDEGLAEWLRAVVERSGAVRADHRARTPTPREDRALRLACDFIGDQPQRNIGLDELAAAAGIGKFPLIRLFRTRIGLTPHALQLAHRLRAARRHLEAGETAAAAAAATGFADQSHLHRHFTRSLGVTPREYQRRFTRGAAPLV